MNIFSIFFIMTVCCGFSLESPHRDKSNEYMKVCCAVHTIYHFQNKKEKETKLSQIYTCENFS